MRRYSRESADGITVIRNIKINTNEAKVYRDGHAIILTAMEYRLLLTLLNNRGNILTRNKLLEEIWDVEGNFVNDKTPGTVTEPSNILDKKYGNIVWYIQQKR